MINRTRPLVTSAIGVLLSSALLTVTATGQSTDEQNTDMQKKHAACEQMKGKQQVECEKHLKDMDKKSKTGPSSVPNREDKKPPESTPPK